MKGFFPFIFKDVYFTKRYKETPTVIVAANHSSSGGNLKPSHNGITTWVEVNELKVLFIYLLFNMKKCHFKSILGILLTYLLFLILSVRLSCYFPSVMF